MWIYATSQYIDPFIRPATKHTSSIPAKPIYRLNIFRRRKRGIINELTESGLHGRLVESSNIFSKIDQYKSESKQTIDNGVLQGSVLSVYCFLLLINNIIHKIPAPIQSHLFADDLSITLQTENLRFAERFLRLRLDGLQEWCNSTGRRFSAHKT